VFHHATDGAIAVLDEGVFHFDARDVFELPVEEFGIESFGAWNVRGVELGVDEWVCHDLSFGAV
jgi:hypothetical protein